MQRNSSRTPALAKRIGLLTVGMIIAIAVWSTPMVAQSPPQDRAQLDQAFAERLNFLADKCRELELPEQERLTRNWLFPRDRNRQYFFLPDDEGTTRTNSTSQLVQQWEAKFTAFREWYAAQLFDLAKQKAAAGDEATAFQWLHEVLQQNPGHDEARQVLGHRRTASGWQTPGRKPAVRQARVTHPDFNWPARRYWRVESDHFVVTTNHSPQAGQDLVERLEFLHSVWQQAFFSYWATPRALAARFAGQDQPLATPPPRNVVLFADREEYVRQLSRGEPQIAVTIGYYSADHRRAYFYASDQPDIATWYHEATHQLFHESANVADNVGERSNFWMIEGIALYMESLESYDGYATLGGFDANRLQFARYRLLNEQFHLPLNELTSLGRSELQQHEDLRRLYSEAAGFAHLLMDFDGGRYRAGTIDFLALLYRGTADAGSLARAIGVPPAELDLQYKQFLDVTDADFQFLRSPNHLQNLSLGHTQITDKSLPSIGKAEHLTWLDLAGTNVSDAGIAKLTSLGELSELTLEGTAITDASLADIGKLTKLADLDLSNTAISDAGLKQLLPLKQLKTLWLTNTTTSDDGAAMLAELPALENLDVRGTRVSAEGRQRLQQRRPNLVID